MKLKIASSAIFATISAFPSDFQWEAWKLENNKNYLSKSLETEKYEIFLKNRQFVNNHNLRFDQKSETYGVKLNKFADLTNAEFSSKYLEKSASTSDSENYNCPVNWESGRDDGKYGPAVTYAGIFFDDFTGGYSRVTPVKNQGDSCSAGSWTFATAGAIEGTLCGQKYQDCSGDDWKGVSSQQQLDCCGSANGCEVGYPSSGMQCVMETGGIESVESYPYNGTPGDGTPASCAYQTNLAVTPTITNCGKTQSGNETELHQVLYEYGPVASRIDASGIGFQFYSHGVYVNNLCSAELEDLNHAMVVTGYGYQEVSYQIEFWECKNSWGADWGEDGYVFMKRNHNRYGNMCGIATDVSYAIIN